MDITEFVKEILEGKVTILVRKVKKHGTSGAVYVPRDLVGKEITVIVIGPSAEKTVTT